MANKTEIEIWTDGAITGNPGGPGGWAAILKVGDHTKELTGNEPETTNNRMELTAVIEGLKVLTKPCQVTVWTDSQYVVRCLNGQYRRKANRDLWQLLDQIVQTGNHEVRGEHVRGHNGNVLNERADYLAVQAKLRLIRELRMEGESWWTQDRTS